MALKSSSTAVCALLTIIIGFFCCQAAGQDVGARKGEFERKIRSKKQALQIEAIGIIETFGDPSGVDLLVKALSKVSSDVDKTRQKYEKLGAKIRSEVAKRIDKRTRNNQVSVAAIEAAEAKIAPLRKEYDELNKKLEDTEELQERLLGAADNLMRSVRDSLKGEAATKFVDHLGKQKKVLGRALFLRMLGTIDHPALAACLAEIALNAKLPAERVAALSALDYLVPKSAATPGEQALNDEHWQVRLVAISLLKKVKSPSSVGPLIARLEIEKGRLVTDIITALRKITGKNFHDNASLWQKWWASNKEGFDPESTYYDPEEDDVAKDKEGAYFFGIETRSKNIIYVLDISGSMLWALDAPNYQPGGNIPFPKNARTGKRRYDFAKKQLLQSIASLPKDGTFNIVYYNGEPKLWKKKMQVATAANKAAVTKWAENLEPGGNTNIFDALEEAFELIGRGSHDKAYKLAADTIYFLSDGRAYRGRITEPNQMLREIHKMNSLRKVQIHSVSIGRSSDHKFMEKIAKQNDGKCVIKQ